MQFPRKIKPLFHTDKRFILLHGGRCSGKTWGAGAQTIIKAAQGANCVACRENANAIDGSIYEVLINTIERLKILGFRHTKGMISHKDGGKIRPIGLKGGSKAETRTRIKGLENVDWAWMEESEAATKEILDIYTKTIRKSGSQQLYTYNRYLDMDPIHEMFAGNLDEKTTEEIILNYWDNPFCPPEEKYEAEKLKEIDYDMWLYLYGGEPMSQSDKAILSRTAVTLAMARDPDMVGAIQAGVDVARYGADSTQMYKRKGMSMIDEREGKKQSIPETARQVMDFVEQDKTVPIKIDDSGLGGGVTDILYEDGYNAIPVNNGEKAKNEDKYPNSISEQWFEFANIINESVLIEDKDLKMQLTSRFFKIDSRGRRVVESKDDYKKRGFKSPDKADAALLCYYEPHSYDIPEESIVMGRRE